MQIVKKKLYSSAITPPHLYIERDADRQLEEIISNMARPGYVLVARQMGKTNLLLNYKRQHPEHIVVYIDLSIRLSSAAEWFRHIIDRAINETEDKDDIQQKIRDIRKLDLEAPVEYDFSISELSRAHPQKSIVIILDEVDSLINSNYSDKILAKVRSTYFDRVNIPELNKVTYVLSGVAEPTELIKDKTISPFNIGIKIHLNNFNIDETRLLIEKAQLNYDASAISYLYEQTQGNPRITWEILTYIEEREIEPSPHSIKEAIQKVYLERKDTPPIDHIRRVIELNQELRSSVLALKFGRDSHLDDRTKNELYLMGIASHTDDGRMRINNPIIDACLPDEWLKNIGSSLERGKKLLTQKKYKEALIQFEDFVAQNGPSKPEGFFFVGLCHYHTESFDDCLNAMLRVTENTHASTDLHKQGLFYLGYCYSKFGNIGKAKECLIKASSTEDKKLSLLAKSYIAPITLLEKEAEHAAAMKACDNLLAAAQEILEEDPESASEFIAISAYQKASILIAMGKQSEARKILYDQVQEAPTIVAIAIQLMLYIIELNTAEKATIAKRAARLLLSMNLEQRTQTLPIPSINETLGLTLSYLAQNDCNELLDALADQIFDARNNRIDSKSTILFKIFYSLNDGIESRRLGPFARYIYKAHRNNLKATEKLALTANIIISYPNESNGLIFEYIKTLEQVGEIAFDPQAIFIALQVIALNADPYLHDSINEALNRIEKTLFKEKLYDFYTSINMAKINSFKTSNPKIARESAVKLALLAVNREASNDPSISSKIPDIIKISNGILSQLPIPSETNGISRGQMIRVRYPNGEEIEAKFKKLEKDILSGRCTIITD